MVLEPLRLPVSDHQWGRGLSLSILDGDLRLEWPRVEVGQWVPVSFTARGHDAGATFVEHLARWLGRSVGQRNPAPGPLPQVAGMFLGTASTVDRRGFQGKAQFLQPEAEIYINLDQAVLLLGEKDEVYQPALMQTFARGLRDGTAWATEFPPHTWPARKPLIRRGPAEDLNPQFAVDSALRLAALGVAKAQARLVDQGTGQLGLLLDDPRTMREALLLIHTRFMNRDADPKAMAGPAAIQRLPLLDALDHAESQLRGDKDVRYADCIRDLRLLLRR